MYICTLVITENKLIKAKPENLIRLARALKLSVQGHSHESLAGLVYASIAAPTMRFNTPDKRAAYESIWEKASNW